MELSMKRTTNHATNRTMNDTHTNDTVVSQPATSGRQEV